jgi:hypothetical protein
MQQASMDFVFHWILVNVQSVFHAGNLWLNMLPAVCKSAVNSGLVLMKEFHRDVYLPSWALKNFISGVWEIVTFHVNGILPILLERVASHTPDGTIQHHFSAVPWDKLEESIASSASCSKQYFMIGTMNGWECMEECSTFQRHFKWETISGWEMSARTTRNGMFFLCLSPTKMELFTYNWKEEYVSINWSQCVHVHSSKLEEGMLITSSSLCVFVCLCVSIRQIVVICHTIY